MANTTRPLTNTEIKQAKAKVKEYNLSDGKGLALRVKPNGSKLWLFNYQRPFTKKRANISFGGYPDISLSEARDRRKIARNLLANDIDPQEHKEEQARIQKEASENTLKLIAKKWMQVKETTVKEETAKDIWRSLELHVFPELAKTPIHKITAKNTIKILEPLANKGTLETVKRLTQRLNEIMVYATNTGIVDHNPLTGINKAFQAPKAQNMPTIEPKELPTLMRSIYNASIKKTTRHLIEWQLHTMTRPSEAAGTAWSEIDFDNSLWHIPAERMKKNLPHSVPLSDAMLVLLESMQNISGHREHVFPADRNPKKHIHSSTTNMALKRMGYHGQLVSHGLRALASTTLNEHGFDAEIIEAALAHKDTNEVRAAYNRAQYIERRRIMMQWWSQHIEAAKQGQLSLTSKKITPNIINMK